MDFSNKKFENTTKDKVKSSGIGVSVYLPVYEYKLLMLLERMMKESRSKVIKKALHLLGEQTLK